MEIDKNKLEYRPLTKKDIPLRAKWIGDPDINRFLGTRTRQGLSAAFHEQWYQKYRKEKSKKIFIITYDGQPIGQVGLTDINLLDENAELYIVIGEKSFHGKGIGTLAVKWICDYGFNKLDLHKIWLEVHADNLGGIACYKKCGFVEEGRFKEQILVGDAYRDEVRMGLIKKQGA